LSGAIDIDVTLSVWASTFSSNELDARSNIWTCPLYA